MTKPRYYCPGRVAISNHPDRLGQWAICDRQDGERVVVYRASKDEAEQQCRAWNRREREKAA